MNTNFDEFLEKVRNYEEKKVKIAVINIEDFGEIEVQRPTASEMLKYQKEMLSAIKDVELDRNKADDEISETDADKMKKIKMDTKILIMKNSLKRQVLLYIIRVHILEIKL